MAADPYGPPPYGYPQPEAYPQPYPPPMPPGPYTPPYTQVPGAGPSVYRAIGTEPFWDLTIGHDMIFTDRGNGLSVVEVTPPARSNGSGSTYRGRRLAVTISRVRCSDGMSDRSYPDTVTVSVDGRPYRGCGAATAYFQQLDQDGGPAGLPVQGVFNLTNTNWRVVSVNGQAAPQSGYYLNFMPDRVSGRFGCNVIGAGYSVQGSTLRAGAVMTTRMLCENNNLEERALAVMARPMTIAESGERLTLGNGAGTIELTRAR